MTEIRLWAATFNYCFRITFRPALELKSALFPPCRSRPILSLVSTPLHGAVLRHKNGNTFPLFEHPGKPNQSTGHHLNIRQKKKEKTFRFCYQGVSVRHGTWKSSWLLLVCNLHPLHLCDLYVCHDQEYSNLSNHINGFTFIMYFSIF